MNECNERLLGKYDEGSLPLDKIFWLYVLPLGSLSSLIRRSLIISFSSSVKIEVINLLTFLSGEFGCEREYVFDLLK